MNRERLDDLWFVCGISAEVTLQTPTLRDLLAHVEELEAKCRSYKIALAQFGQYEAVLS